MSRTFPSAKAAIGYAVAVQASAAGPASRRDSAPGPAPDPWLAASIFACLRRAGINPHSPTCPVLRGVLDWATHADGSLAEDSRVGVAVRRASVELEAVGIVCPPPPPEPTGWRAIRLRGEVRYVTTTRFDQPGVYLDKSTLRRAVEAGEVAPDESHELALDPDAARRYDLDLLEPLVRAGTLSAEGLDRALAKLWGCSERTARRHRTRLGLLGRRGPRPREYGDGVEDRGEPPQSWRPGGVAPE